VPPTIKPRLRFLTYDRGRWYFRKGHGPRTPLPDRPGTVAFMAAYRAAFNGDIKDRTLKLKRRRPLKSDHQTYVYFMLVRNRVKIGFSKNPKRRAEDLQTALPDKISVVLKMKGGRELEREMHARFKDLRLGREWFAYHGALADFIHGREEVDLVL